MNINIKNMVCLRCIMLVKKILDDMEIKYLQVNLGEADLKYPLTKIQKEQLALTLNSWGLELIDGNKDILVDRIKRSVIKMVHDDSMLSTLKISHYLSTNLNYNYTYIANVFSQETGTCLRDFIIAHKVEKIKEMLIMEGMSVTEIAWKLNYSSVSHLSNQFTKVTGLSPSKFKKGNNVRLIPLENVGMLEAV
jgi:AraC-like DNA-binding protein